MSKLFIKHFLDLIWFSASTYELFKKMNNKCSDKYIRKFKMKFVFSHASNMLIAISMILIDRNLFSFKIKLSEHFEKSRI